MGMYSSSLYNVLVPCSHDNHLQFAVFNTLSSALCLVKQEDWSKLLEDGFLSGDTQKLGADLADQGFLLPAGFTKEQDIFRHCRQQQVHDLRSMGAKVLLTMACNNRCRYCIIDREPVSMSAETARTMDQWYCRHIDENRPQQVTDDYLGGEPLLMEELLLAVAGRRFTFCRERGIAYSFSITTNGRLLNRAIVWKLKEIGLENVRVSMAGPADIHDSLRPGQNGEPTYAEIVANLTAVSDLIPVVVECQYDGLSADFRRMPEMMDDFLARNIRVRQIHFNPILAQRCSCEYPGGLNDPRKQIWLLREAAKRAMSDESGPPTNNCLAELRSRMVFDCRGNLLPCPALQTGELAYGNVLTGVDFRAEALLCQRRLPDGCRNGCAVVPLCKGGCRNQALVARGDFDTIDCRRDELLFLVKHYIVAEIMKAGVVFDVWDEVFDLPCSSECQGLDWHI